MKFDLDYICECFKNDDEVHVISKFEHLPARIGELMSDPYDEVRVVNPGEEGKIIKMNDNQHWGICIDIHWSDFRGSYNAYDMINSMYIINLINLNRDIGVVPDINGYEDFFDISRIV